MILRRVAVVLAVSPCLVSSASTAGVSYYVDASSPSCSSSGPGTEARPYCSIAAALDAHGLPGTTIVVKPGNYFEQVSLPASGVPGSPLVLRAQASGVVLDGADDYSLPSKWEPLSGDVWLASGVTWAPRQVFIDGARIDTSGVAPAALPSRTFRWVSGSGLYVHAGGGNPGAHQARVGRRDYGFSLPARSWIVIDGFTVIRTEDRGIFLSGGCNHVTLTRNTVAFTRKMGIQAVGGSGHRIGSNVVHDCGDHGISLLSGVSGSTVEDNESFRNARPGTRAANGIYLFGSPHNVLRRNRLHDNQDTGLHIQSGSDSCIAYDNRSWSNGDHGYDNLDAAGTIHVGDVAYGNHMDGFSIEGNAPGTQLHNCIAVDNGLTTGEFDLWVDLASSSGFVSDYNLFWNSTSQPPVKYIATLYASVSKYREASGQDARTLQANPRFVDAAAGDFRLRADSPAIDNGNSTRSPSPTDAAGHARFDDPRIPNRGAGPMPYMDRGALEYTPDSLTLKN